MFHAVAGSPHHNDADSGIAQILLELDSLIGGHSHLQSFSLAKTDQFAVGHAFPALRMDGEDLMAFQMTRQLTWEGFV
jgi:hypothetical protein